MCACWGTCAIRYKVEVRVEVRLKKEIMSRIKWLKAHVCLLGHLRNHACVCNFKFELKFESLRM